MHGDGQPVSHELWQEAHADLVRRVDKLERWREQVNQAGRDRRWNLTLAFLTGVVAPLLVVAVVAVVTYLGHR